MMTKRFFTFKKQRGKSLDQEVTANTVIPQHTIKKPLEGRYNIDFHNGRKYAVAIDVHSGILFALSEEQTFEATPHPHPHHRTWWPLSKLVGKINFVYITTLLTAINHIHNNIRDYYFPKIGISVCKIQHFLRHLRGIWFCSIVSSFGNIFPDTLQG